MDFVRNRQVLCYVSQELACVWRNTDIMPARFLIFEACSHTLIHFSLVCNKGLTNGKNQQQYCTRMYLQFAGAVLRAVKLGKGITSTRAEAVGETDFYNCFN